MSHAVKTQRRKHKHGLERNSRQLSISRHDCPHPRPTGEPLLIGPASSRLATGRFLATKVLCRVVTALRRPTSSFRVWLWPKVTPMSPLTQHVYLVYIYTAFIQRDPMLFKCSLFVKLHFLIRIKIKGFLSILKKGATQGGM